MFTVILLSSLSAIAGNNSLSQPPAIFIGHSYTGSIYPCSYIAAKESGPNGAGNTWQRFVENMENEAKLNAENQCWARYQDCEVLDLSLMDHINESGASGCFGQATVRGH